MEPCSDGCVRSGRFLFSRAQTRTGTSTWSLAARKIIVRWRRTSLRVPSRNHTDTSLDVLLRPEREIRSARDADAADISILEQRQK